MMELFVDLSIAGLKSADEVPVPFLQMLAMVRLDHAADSHALHHVSKLCLLPVPLVL